jgi:3'-phosphoadenosine 5'-phosphosulfate (PAPS) 3'-phosphatase
LQGFIASGVAFAVQIWCIDRGGPVFVAVYQPVQTLVVAIMASITLGEKFYLGGVIGAALIITGLYFVLWGKSEEKARNTKEAIIAAANSSGGGERETRSAKLASSITQPLLPPSSTTSDNV